MKNLLKPLRIAVLSVLALVAAPAAHAQVTVSINPPSWGPAVSQGQQYYYIPEYQGFYDVPARQYVVLRDGRWIRTENLSGYDPRGFHPVVVDYVGAQPWSRYDEYRARYPRGGNPSNGAMPPGQAKKYGYRANPSNGGLPPGQAKKMYGRRDDDRRENDDRRYERRDDERRDNDRYGDDDHGKGGKGKDKGKDKD